MGWWRQPLSVKAQTALSLSQPGQEGQDTHTHTHTQKRYESNKRTHKHKNTYNMDAEADYIHTDMLRDQTAGL